MVTIVSCGILKCEVTKVVKDLDISVNLVFMPPQLHLYPFKLAEELKRKLERTESVVVVYGKCCTKIDEICKMYNAHRIKGENCYEIVAGDKFYQLLQKEPGTYFLLPQLCTQFDELTSALGLREPGTPFFKNYRQCVALDTGVGSIEQCREVAQQLGLPCRREYVGIELLESRLKTVLKKVEKQ